VKALNFAVVGHYPELDSQILSIQKTPIGQRRAARE
jgi:hypothetical protein